MCTVVAMDTRLCVRNTLGSFNRFRVWARGGEKEVDTSRSRLKSWPVPPVRPLTLMMASAAFY